MILEHLGKLHPVENALVLVLAFGPVLLLAVSVRIARKRNAPGAPGGPGGPSDPVDPGDPVDPVASGDQADPSDQVDVLETDDSPSGGSPD